MLKFVMGVLVLWVGWAGGGSTVLRAEETKRPAAGSVQINFLPPPLEKATYSLGIFDARTGKLVRQLQSAALEKDFTVGLNGLVTSWDGKDDSGKLAPFGRYAARGYAVGALKVEGEAIKDNDWAEDDENLRLKQINAIGLVPADNGLVLLATSADDKVRMLRVLPADGHVLWSKVLDSAPVNRWATPPVILVGEKQFYVEAGRAIRTFSNEDGREVGIEREDDFTLKPAADGPRPPSPLECQGRDETRWSLDQEGGLVQTSAKDEPLRKLAAKAGEPLARAISASDKEDRLYLLEEKPGWQRVRGLSWVETREEDGRPVSTWKTFFERSVHQPSSSAGTKEEPLEVNLDENPLAPGKLQKVRLVAVLDARGSYLATENGLHLRRISERLNLQSAHLAKGTTTGSLAFFQYDGAATDEFSIKGVRNIMAFDAGEFEWSANGEKSAETRATEPPDL